MKRHQVDSQSLKNTPSFQESRSDWAVKKSMLKSNIAADSISGEMCSVDLPFNNENGTLMPDLRLYNQSKSINQASSSLLNQAQ